MYFQPSPFSRPRQAVDAPRTLNLREHNCEQAARRARAMRTFTSQIARDHAYLHSLPYLESRSIDAPAPSFPQGCEQLAADGLPEEGYYEGEDVSNWAEDILLRCPTRVCCGRLMEVHSGLGVAYVCSEENCPVRVVGSAQRWDLFRLCETLSNTYGFHQFCGNTPSAFLSSTGTVTVKCECGFEQEAQ